MQKLYKNYPDVELWQEFKKGDIAAFDYIFEKYVRILYNYCHKFTSDTTVIEDCIQDLFTDLWEKRSLLGETDSIKYYLYKSIRLRVIRALTEMNKLGNKQEIEDVAHFEVSFSHEVQLIADQTTQEEHKLLTEALSCLSKRQKEAVYLKYYDNLTYAEIASVMTIRVEAVYKLVSGALGVLKKHTFKLE